MKIRMWDRTDIIWTEGFPTSIPISDWWERGKVVYHEVRHMRMFSQMDGTGEGYLVVKRCGSCPNNNDIAIAKRLLAGLEKEGQIHSVREDTSAIPGTLRFSFVLRDNVPFVDAAVTIARKVIALLGCPEERAVRYLARFQIHKATKVKVRGTWVGFADYIRHRHGLPAFLGSGWSDS